MREDDQKREYGPADIANAEELYAKTGNPVYIVLAIGAESAEPPFWAMTAARDLARRAEGAATNGNQRVKRGRLLDDIVREFFALHDAVPMGSDYTPPPLKAVIRTVLEREGCHRDAPEFPSNQKGLEVAWRKEAQGFELDPSGVPMNARWKRMLHEWGDKNSDLPYSQLLDQPWKFKLLVETLFLKGKK